MVEKAFAKQKPLFVLGVYYPLSEEYYIGPQADIDPLAKSRQKMVVGLIRTGFLKRFESSVYAFEHSCDRLLVKLLSWVERNVETEAEQRRLERWKQKHAELIGYVHHRQHELFDEPEDEEEEEDDLITDEMREAIPKLPRELYKVDQIIFQGAGAAPGGTGHRHP